MISKRGQMITTEEIELSERNIANVQEHFKYLRILQINGNHAKTSTIAKYLHRVMQVLRSQLKGWNKIGHINTYDLPIIRYPAGIIT